MGFLLLFNCDNFFPLYAQIVQLMNLSLFPKHELVGLENCFPECGALYVAHPAYPTITNGYGARAASKRAAILNSLACSGVCDRSEIVCKQRSKHDNFVHIKVIIEDSE